MKYKFNDFSPKEAWLIFRVDLVNPGKAEKSDSVKSKKVLKKQSVKKK